MAIALSHLYLPRGFSLPIYIGRSFAEPFNFDNTLLRICLFEWYIFCLFYFFHRARMPMSTRSLDVFFVWWIYSTFKGFNSQFSLLLLNRGIYLGTFCEATYIKYTRWTSLQCFHYKQILVNLLNSRIRSTFDHLILCFLNDSNHSELLSM